MIHAKKIIGLIKGKISVKPYHVVVRNFAELGKLREDIIKVWLKYKLPFSASKPTKGWGRGSEQIQKF